LAHLYYSEHQKDAKMQKNITNQEHVEKRSGKRDVDWRLEIRPEEDGSSIAGQTGVELGNVER